MASFSAACSRARTCITDAAVLLNAVLFAVFASSVLLLSPRVKHAHQVMCGLLLHTTQLPKCVMRE